MSLSNEQLLYLSALVYYNIDKLETSNELDSIVSNIKKTGVTTCFDGAAGYTDKELGMDKIISFIENDSELMNLQLIYPDKKDTTTSSVCFINKDTSEVYVVFCGNYIDSPYIVRDDDGKQINISEWTENVKGSCVSDTESQKRELKFYEDAINVARKELNNIDGDIDITVCGHSTGGNQHSMWQLRMKRSIGNEKNVEKSKLINYTVKVKRDRGQTYRNVWTQSQ